MESTSPRGFRANLKTYMEMATEKPIRIQRRDGDSCILMSEDYYEKLLAEVSNLQKSLLSSNQVISGNTKEYKIGDRSRLNRFKK
jgi:PHD/YefM family antitoxin component YafN of YafNO toxin-antitoxin module